MTMMTTVAADERVLATLLQGLEAEFGRDAGEALAMRFLAAEEGDFLWEARLDERWLGRYSGVDGNDDDDLERVAILARLGRKWTAATLLIDGEGSATGLIGRRDFRRRYHAQVAYLQLH